MHCGKAAQEHSTMQALNGTQKMSLGFLKKDGAYICVERFRLRTSSRKVVRAFPHAMQHCESGRHRIGISCGNNTGRSSNTDSTICIEQHVSAIFMMATGCLRMQRGITSMPQYTICKQSVTLHDSSGVVLSYTQWHHSRR
jgi:hypothetical protein